MANELRLIFCAGMSDWYVLEGGENWASIEGTAEEWAAIARGLRDGAGDSFKRCSAHKAGDKWIFHSPRNAHRTNDWVSIPLTDGAKLADHIDAVIALYATPREHGDGREGRDGR